MAPMSQQLPNSPREAIQVIRDALDRLETQPLVRDFQAVGTAQVSSTPRRAFITREVTDSVQRMGLGYTSLIGWITEAAQQQTSTGSTTSP